MSKINLKKKDANAPANVLSARRLRYGGFATLITALVLAVIILVNVVAGVVEDNWALSIDLSPTSVTKFDEATKTTAESIEYDVVIYLLFQDSTSSELRVQLEEMGKKYHAINNHITYEFLDPYTQPAMLSKYIDVSTTSLAEGSVIVTRADDSKFRTISRTNLYRYSYVEDSTSSWGYSYAQAFDGEAQITSALAFVGSDETPNVYFLSGHNEIGSDHCSYLLTYLQQENYNVETLTLSAEKALLPGDTIIVSAPETDLTDEEYQIMVDFLAAGGRLMMTMPTDKTTADLKNFSALLMTYQLSFGEGFVVEDANATTRWTSNTMMVIPELDAENDITKTLAENGRRLIVYGGRPINACDIPLSGVSYNTLLTSSTGSYVKSFDSKDVTDPSDAIDTGSQILAYTAMKQQDVYDSSKDTRIALLSSYYLYADTNLITSCYNLDFTMSVIEWLVNRDVSVYVRASAIINTTLEIPDAATEITIAVVCVGVIPLLIVAAGIVIWIRRRRL